MRLLTRTDDTKCGVNQQNIHSINPTDNGYKIDFWDTDEVIEVKNSMDEILDRVYPEPIIVNLLVFEDTEGLSVNCLHRSKFTFIGRFFPRIGEYITFINSTAQEAKISAITWINEEEVKIIAYQ